MAQGPGTVPTAGGVVAAFPRLLIALVLFASGCGSAPKPEAAGDKERREALAQAPQPTPAARTLQFDPGNRAHLAAVYCRLSGGDNTVLAEYAMVDERGLPDAARMSAYQAAIGALARRPGEWEKFLADSGKCAAAIRAGQR